MGRLSYINITDDVNASNVAELRDIKKKAALYITEKFSTPTPKETEELVGDTSKLDLKDSTRIKEQVKKALDTVSPNTRNIVISELFSDLEKLGANDTIKRNSYIKILYWLSTMFKDILDRPSTIVVYHAPLGKYEIYTLFVLSKLGINVVVISKDTEGFKHPLYTNAVFELQGTNENLSLDEVKVREIKQYTKLAEVKTSLETGLKSVAIKGCNSDSVVELSNFVYWLSRYLPEKSTLLFKTRIDKPNYAESSAISKPALTSTKEIVKAIARVINITSAASDIKLVKQYEKFCLEAFKNESNMNRVFSYCCMIAVWSNRYLLYKHGKNCIVHYGSVDGSTEKFLEFADSLGVAVIAICTEKSDIELNNFDTLEFTGSIEPFDFPTVEIKERQSTVAYNALKEIDKLMYNGMTPGLYRDKQFNTCQSVKLGTTYDEIGILWHQESKFRPHFEVKDNIVSVPNFFVKLSGCQEDYKRYLNEIARLVDDNTIVHYSTMFANIQPNNLKMHIRRGLEVSGTIACEQKRVIDNHKINPDVIMGYKNYGYGFLSRDTQLHMMYKIQELIDSKCIDKGTLSEEGYCDTILNVVLNLNTEVLRLIQWFDFTKLIPKVVVISQTETQVSYEDTIYLAYLSLLGFDVAVVVPTAYNSIEKYLTPNMFQEHILGQAKFDTHITNLTVQTDAKGWLGKLFGNN